MKTTWRVAKLINDYNGCIPAFRVEKHTDAAILAGWRPGDVEIRVNLIETVHIP